MERYRISIQEIIFTLSCILIGVAAAVMIAPKNSYFFSNFTFYWLPQAVLLATLLITRCRLPVICGVALILSGHLVCFNFWISSKPHPDSMTWLGYLFSLPGAAIGAFSSALAVKHFKIDSSLILGGIAFSFTLVGLILNQVFICTTLMYCTI